MQQAFINAMADEIGKAIADAKRAWTKEAEIIAAESRAAIAEFKSTLATLGAELSARIDARLSALKDGRDGQPGQDGADGADGRDGIDGKDGAPGKDGLPGQDGEPGLNGKDGINGKDGVSGRDGVDGRDGRDGKDADEDSIVARVLVSIKDDLPGLIKLAVVSMSDDLRGEPGPGGKDGLDGKDGAPGKDGEPGRDGTDGQPGLDGRDGIDGANGKDGKDGLDGKDGAPGQDGRPGIDGKDGRGISDAFIDGDGVLILTYSDGETKTVGRVLGKDGAPGRDGRDGAPGGPPGPKGDPGERGADGRSIEDKGVWTQSEEYPKGAFVSFGGSGWIKQVDGGKDKPGEGKAWRLAIKKGRDGKDAK